jgi:hypothetical protein
MTAKKASPSLAATQPAVPTAKAYKEILPLLAAIPDDSVQTPNVDIAHAASIALATVPRLAALRAEAAALPDFDIENFDRLGTYALAAWYAQIEAAPKTTENPLVALVAKAKPLREDLLLAAELLAHKGFFDAKSVDAIVGGNANLQLANDLESLAALFSSHWAAVEHKSPVTRADVDHAAKLGPQLLAALGTGDKATKVDADAIDTRNRAWTLFADAYDQCRRAVTYLRWNEGDADTIAPSLHSGEKKKKKPDAPPGPEPEPPAPTPPATAPSKANK